MTEIYYVVPEDRHAALVSRAFQHRGYGLDETLDVVRNCTDAARHGIRTHNAIKALHLEHRFGGAVGGCVPGAVICRKAGQFASARVWDAQKKIGPSVAYAAMDECIALAEEYGVGMVSVDNAWHYFWGGGYVLSAAKRGYIGYTQCTAMLAEVVPFQGRSPALGTNPHSWAFPTVKSAGFPVLVDWATSAIAMGRVQQLQREGKSLPENSAVDSSGRVTCDPEKVVALLPFGGHKGYGLGLINEIMAGYIGGYLPTRRGRFPENGDKRTTCFFFMAIHPDALNAQSFCHRASVDTNVEAIVQDLLGPGNEQAVLPGEPEAKIAALSDLYGGLLFNRSEMEAFRSIALECGEKPWDPTEFRCVQIDSTTRFRDVGLRKGSSDKALFSSDAVRR